MSKKSKPACKDATDETKLTTGVRHDPGRRFPFIDAPEAYDAISATDLNEDEKHIGKTLTAFKMASPEGVHQPPEHSAIQRRNPTYMMQWDPDLFMREVTDYEVMAKLAIGMTSLEIMQATDENGLKIDDPDVRRRYHIGMLMVTKLAHEYQCEWIQRLMSTVGGWTLSKEQFCVLGQPQSATWSEEERLALEFTEGFVRRAVSDELFARAKALWGRKQLLRYSKWLAYYVGLLMMTMVDISDAERRGPVAIPQG